MRTELQAAASRANGARSRGPVTGEGKAAAARNAFRHGLYSRDYVLLATEDSGAFDRLRSEILAYYAPGNIVETQIVREMALTQWRRMRAEVLEASLIDIAMDRMAPALDKDFEGADDVARTALAYENLHRSGQAAQDLAREIARLSRQFLRLDKALSDIRSRSAAKKSHENEPEPHAADRG